MGLVLNSVLLIVVNNRSKADRESFREIKFKIKETKQINLSKQ